MDSLRVYLKYISMSIRSQMMYKASFVYLVLGNFMITVIEFVGVLALFDRFDTLLGWQLEEVALFYGVINCGFALAESFGRGYDVFSRLVRNGAFDRLLLRPRSLVLQIMGMELQLMRIGRFLQGLVVTLWAMNRLAIPLFSYKASLISLCILGSVFLFMGLFVLQATVSFWSIQSLEMMNAFTYGGVQMGQYPISIYKKWFQKLFTYLIPLALVVHIPLEGVLDHGDHGAYIVGAPFIGFLFFLLSLLVFQLGVKHYKSTGS